MGIARCFTWILTLGAGIILVSGCDQAASSSQNTQVAGGQAANAHVQPVPAQNAGARQPADVAHQQDRSPATPGPVLGPPPVEFDPPVLDFGVVKPGQRVSGTVYIQNTSDKWLKIVSSKPSCTCTSVDLANTSLAPGERVPMRADYHASAIMGPKQAAVKVRFEGYDDVQVDIKANVLLPIRAEPSFISAVPAADGSQSLTGEISLTSMDQKPFRVLAVNGGAVPFVGFDPDHDQLQNAYQIKWDLTPYNPATCTDSKGNRMPGWIIVETDREDCPVFHLEIRHQCTMRQRPKPGETWLIQDKCMLVGGVKPGNPIEFELLANWFPNAAQNDPIRSVVSESNQFAAELINVEKVNGTMVCHIKVTPGADYRGLIYGNLRIHSNNQSYPITIIGTSR